MAQSNHRRAMIAKIKIAQKQLGMDDDVYRELLHRMAGKRSCTELTATELARVNLLDSNQMHRLTAALQIYANRQQNPKK